MSDQATIETRDPYKPTPLTAEQRWAEQEKLEKVKKLKGLDNIDEVFGTTIKFINYSGAGMTINGKRFEVLRFYTTVRAVFDMPKTVEEAAAKRAAINAMGMPYICLLPNEAKQQKDLIAELSAERRRLKAGSGEAVGTDAAAQLAKDEAVARQEKAERKAAKDEAKQLKVKAQKVAKKKSKGKVGRVLAMLLCLAGASVQLLANTAIYPNDAYALPRARTDTHEKILGVYSADINGNSLNPNTSANGATMTSAQGAPGNAAWYMSQTITATGLQNFQLNANTACAGVIGTSVQYLTITAKSSVFISNLSTGSIFWLLTNSLTPPTNTNVLRQELPAGQQLCLSAALGDLVAGYNFLHYTNPNPVSSTGTNTWN